MFIGCKVTPFLGFCQPFNLTFLLKMSNSMLNSAECKVEFAVKAFTGVFTVPMFQIGKGSFFFVCRCKYSDSRGATIHSNS